VIVNITDVTYKINCGRKGKPQVIHVDRIRKKYPQNLPGEESEQIVFYARKQWQKMAYQMKV
jgi:hypothetical protein